MKVKLACFAAGVCLLAAVTSCSKSSPAPVGPSAAAPESAEANADGSTLKVERPTNQSPANGSKPEQSDTIALVVANSTSRNGVAVAGTYRFQVFSPTGAVIADVGNVAAGTSTTTFNLSTANLEGDVTYTWQSRLEFQGESGPFSARTSFIATASDGYIRGAELYDPLINGKTVGNPSGPMTFIPGVGLRFHEQVSVVSYVLPATLSEGEYSLLLTGMDTNTDGGKTKIMSMAQGFGDITTNDRRATIEKRGDPAGVIAWRLITHGDQIDTEGAEREFVPFDRNKLYFWQTTWRNNFFNVLIREGGVDGRQIYSKGKGFKGRAYDPIPHVIFLGSPIGRGGPDDASVDNVTFRQVWVSARPRPAFANR